MSRQTTAPAGSLLVARVRCASCACLLGTIELAVGAASDRRGNHPRFRPVGAAAPLIHAEAEPRCGRCGGSLVLDELRHQAAPSGRRTRVRAAA